MKNIGIIIPFHNEEKVLNEMVKIIIKMDSSGLKKTIYLIDDASTDETYKIMIRLEQKYKNLIIIKNKNNLGQNESLKKSLNIIPKHDIYLTLDGDNQHPTNKMKSLINTFINEELDFFHGRKIKEIGGDNLYRKIMSKVAALILTIVYFNKNINSTNFFLFNNKVRNIIVNLKTKNSLSVEIIHKHKYLKMSFFRYVVNRRLDGISTYSFIKRFELLIGLINDRFKI